MIPFVSTHKYYLELNRVKLREEILRGMIVAALRNLRRAQGATAPVEDCVGPAIRLLHKALVDVSAL